MPFECHFTGKKTTFGRKKAYGGAKISKGGFGLKTTGITRRTFKPNLQKMNVVVTDDSGNSRAKKVYVSTEAIRAGLVTKPLKRKYGYTRQQKQTDDH
jgi:large subunit ribosomal protein L28